MFSKPLSPSPPPPLSLSDTYRYCQPPADFWDWFEPYIDDPEVGHQPSPFATVFASLQQ